MAIRLSRLFVTCLLTASAFLGCGGGGGGGESLPAPTGLQAQWSETVAGVVHLSWNPSPGDVQSYRIEYRMGTADFALVYPAGILPATNTSTDIYFDGIVLPEITPLDFRVCALKNGSKSPFGTVASLMTPLYRPTTPSVETWVGGLRVTWSNPSVAAETVTLDRGLGTAGNMAGATWTRIATLTRGAREYIDLDVPENTYVSYRLTNAKGEARAVSSDSYSVHSSLQGPVGLTATAGTERVRLAWTNRSPNATSIVVKRYEGFVDMFTATVIATLPANATSYEDVGLATGHYSYLVEARKEGSSVGSPSGTVRVATLPTSDSGLVLQTSVENMPSVTMGGLDQNGRWVLPVSYGSTTSGILTGSGTSWAWHSLDAAYQVFMPGMLWDAAGRPHLVIARAVAQGSPTMVLLHVWNDGVNWQTEEITRTTLGYGFGSVRYAKLDASGNPVLIYQTVKNSTTGVRLAMKVGGGWQVEDVTPGWTQAPQHLAVTLDGSGAPVVLAGFETTLQLLRRTNPGAWVEEAVPQDLNGGYFGGMDLLATSNGDIHIIACRSNPGDVPGGRILVTRRTTGGWTPVTAVLSHATYVGDYALCHLSPAGDQIAVGYNSYDGTWALSYRQGAWSTAHLGPRAELLPFIGFTAEGKLRVLQNATGYYYDGSNALFVVYSEP